MRNVWTIGVREFKGFFTSAVGYVVMICWLAFSGLIHFLVLASPQAIASMDALFHNWAILLVILMPLITMRQFAGERSGDQGIGTIELLLTSPITEWELVLGKFLGAVLYMLSLAAASLVYPISMMIVGKPDIGPIYAGYVGFFLLSSYILAVGLFMSSLTSSQIVAAITSIVGLLGLWLVQYLGQIPGLGKWGEAIAWWSMMKHHEDFWRGLITFTDVAWYVSMIFIALLAAKQVIASSRWR